MMMMMIDDDNQTTAMMHDERSDKLVTDLVDRIMMWTQFHPPFRSLARLPTPTHTPHPTHPTHSSPMEGFRDNAHQPARSEGYNHRSANPNPHLASSSSSSSYSLCVCRLLIPLLAVHPGPSHSRAAMRTYFPNGYVRPHLLPPYCIHLRSRAHGVLLVSFACVPFPSLTPLPQSP